MINVGTWTWYYVAIYSVGSVVIASILFGLCVYIYRIAISVMNALESRKLDVNELYIDCRLISVLSRTKKQFSKMRKIVLEYQDVPAFQTTWEIAKQLIQRQSEILHDSSEKLKGFAKLSDIDKYRAQEVMHFIRRESEAAIQKAKLGLISPEQANFDVTEKYLITEVGLSPQAAKAAMDVFDYMQNDATEYIREGLYAQADGDSQKQALADVRVKALKEWNGVKHWDIHFSREGHFFVHAKDSKTGETKAFHLVDGTTNAFGKFFGKNSKILKLKKQYEAKGLTVEYGKHKRAQQLAYDDLPLRIASMIDTRGVIKRLEGTSKNIEDSIFNYVYGLSNFASKSQARVDFQKALEEAGTKASYREMLSAHQEEFLSNVPSTTKLLRKLGLKMASPVDGEVTQRMIVRHIKVIGFMLVALLAIWAYITVNRYQIEAHKTIPVVYLLDRWNGKVYWLDQNKQLELTRQWVTLPDGDE